MSTIKFDKLIRDRIPEIIRNANKTAVTEAIPPTEMLDALDHKLQEEVSEYLESRAVEELADVLEVLHGIAYHTGISWNEIEAVRLQKKAERGGFEQGLRLLEVRDKECLS